MIRKRRTILITGGMGGIGQAVARKCAADGDAVYLLYHASSPDEASAFCSSLPNASIHKAFQCDITDRAAVESVLATVEQETSGIDVCVHAAVSRIVRRRISLIDPDDFKQQFAVTAFGGLNVLQVVVEYMKKRGEGCIIGLTTAALLPGAQATTMAGYICAKHALNGMLRELHNDVSIHNIRVNAVAPGFVETPLQSDLPEAALAMIREKSDDIAMPEDVADVVAWLCSPDATSVSGETYLVGKKEHYPL